MFTTVFLKMINNINLIETTYLKNNTSVNNFKGAATRIY